MLNFSYFLRKMGSLNLPASLTPLRGEQLQVTPLRLLLLIVTVTVTVLVSLTQNLWVVLLHEGVILGHLKHSFYSHIQQYKTITCLANTVRTLYSYMIFKIFYHTLMRFGLHSVSYTHLDVYKRQYLYCYESKYKQNYWEILCVVIMKILCQKLMCSHISGYIKNECHKLSVKLNKNV